jgi:hypothetical protein
MPDQIMTPSADPSNDDNPGAPDTPLAAANQDSNPSPSPSPTPASASTPPPSLQTQSSPVTATIPSTQPTPAPTASNPDPNASHPLVKGASIIRSVAQTLAGGPRYTVTIDPVTGQTTRTAAPLSKSDILLGIAATVLNGAATGVGTTGPNSAGRAAASAFQQSQQRVAQQSQAEQAQAEAAANQSRQALIAHANAAEANSRTILNTSQSERIGVESLKDAVSQNAQLLSDYDDAGAIQDRNVSQDQLMAGMKDGTYDATRQIAIPDGFTTIGGKYEQTFSVIASPEAKVPLTPEQVKQFASAGIPGFLAFRDGRVPADGVQVPGTVVARANQQLQAINLMKQDVSSVQDTLAKSGDKGNQALAQSIPDLQLLIDDPQRGAGLFNALSRFQKYVSHSDQHGMDFYESLQQMASPSKPNPLNPKQFVANSDAPFANTIAGALGNGDPQKGWAILKAYSKELAPVPVTNETQATAVLADPDSSSKAKVQARNFLTITQQQKVATAGATAGAEERARQTAEAATNAANGSQADVATLGESLAKGSLTEDMIPGFSKIKPQIQAYLAQHHPNLDQSSLQVTGEERKRRDLAQNALSNLGIIQGTLQRRPDLLGLIQGRVSQGKELVGTNDADLTAVGEALDNYALAATGAHGIRAVEARQSAKLALLNGFKNGPAGVNSSINTAKQSLQEFANAGKPRGLDGSAYVYGTQPKAAAQPNQLNQPNQLTNIQVNPQTKQRIGWNGTAWVDATTLQRVQ